MNWFTRIFQRNTAKKNNKRAFAASQFGRLLGDWVSSGTSADSEVKASLRRLRERSRQLIRDNDYARNIIRAFKTNVVGSGVGFQSQVRMIRGPKLDEKINGMIEDAWNKWCKKENCHAAGLLHFSDIERLAIASVVESGEVFIRIITQPMGTMKIPMALEVLEADLLDEMYNAILDNGNVVKMGIETDQWKRPVAYHFFRVHPGEDGFSNITTEGLRRIRVPANEVIHLFVADRVSQTRGIPWLASSMLRMHHLAGYEEAEVVAARATSALMGFITSPEGDLQGDDVQNSERVTDFEPGVYKYLAPGEKVDVPQLNRPSGVYDPFVRSQLRGISSGAGISYETLSRDYSQTNYSSTRQALLEDRDHYRVLQAWLISNFHQIIYNKWLDLAVLSDEIRIPGYETKTDFYNMARWMPRGWTWIDPLKEVNAYREAVRSGFTTLSEVVAQSGGDIEDLLTQRKRELDMCESLDLVFDTDPNQIDDKGQTQPPPPTEPMSINPKAENA